MAKRASWDFAVKGPERAASDRLSSTAAFHRLVRGLPGRLRPKSRIDILQYAALNACIIRERVNESRHAAWHIWSIYQGALIESTLSRDIANTGVAHVGRNELSCDR